MKGRPVDQLVYEYMFPRPKTSDPQNFHAVLTRHLIYEVRQEVHSFYGHLETQEAKYPGLDYCHPTHRIRLSRWQWHRRLFRAFDGLRLTPAEIAGLTKWEGTKWAKERFEKEQGIVIRDTSADEMSRWVEPVDGFASQVPSGREDTRVAEQPRTDENMDGEDSDEEEELQSIGVALNEQLRERVAAHNAGDTSQPLDEDWEQWLKNAIETGEFALVAEQIARLSSTQSSSMTPEDIFPARIIDAAREGNWHEVPDFLHAPLRQSLETERRQQQVRRSAAAAAAAVAEAPGAPSRSSLSAQNFPVVSRWRRTYSDLRLPVSDGGTGSAADIRVQRTAQAPGA